MDARGEFLCPDFLSHFQILGSNNHRYRKKRSRSSSLRLSTVISRTQQAAGWLEDPFLGWPESLFHWPFGFLSL